MAEGEASTGPGLTGALEPPDDLEPTTPSWFARSEPTDPAPPLQVCQFLGTEVGQGSFGPAIAASNDANRCFAMGPPAPQSARQQELVCLAAAHRSCPRYLRGVLLLDSPPPVRRREPMSRAVVVSALVLVAAIAASFGFLAVRGGLSVAIANASPSPDSSQVAVVPPASIAPVNTPAPSARPSATLRPSGSPAASVAPSAPTSPSSTPAPATPAPTPRPSSDRYAVLEPCPSTPDCWIYTVRSGDNLVSIAHWFGVPLDTVYDLNPWARTTGLKAGQELRLPPPTR